MSAAADRGLAPPARLAFATALAATLAVAAWLVWRTAILEPYSDMFDWMVRYYRLQADGDFGRYLWAPHNFHHLVWTFLVLDLDIRAFGASSYLFLAVGVLCLVATAAMLAGVAAQAAGAGLRLVGAGGAAALSAMGCHVLDASADINTTYLHALAFAVAAILLAEAPPTGRWTQLRPFAALACAVAAGLGSAAGLAVWPALLFGAWRRGDRRWMFAVLAAGLAFAAIYALGETAPLNPASGALGWRRAVEAGGLIANYLGLPWVRGLPQTGPAIGLAVLGVSIWAVAFGARGPAAWPQRAASPLILFSLGTAVMVGVARTGVLAPGVAPMRYAVFLIPLHAGLWILALPYLRGTWLARRRSMEAVVISAGLLMVAHQGVMALYAVRTADANREVIDQFHAGARSAQMLTTIYPDLAKAAALSARMRSERLYQHELRLDPAAGQRIGNLGFMD